MDDSLLTESLLVNLQQYVPTPEEQGKLSVFVKSASEEELEQLSKPDAFCVEVRTTYKLKPSVQLLTVLFR